jgi:hypothetical protein
MDGELSFVVHFGDDETIELSLMLEELIVDEHSSTMTIPPDPSTIIELAGYLGRYESQEEKFRAAATA